MCKILSINTPGSPSDLALWKTSSSKRIGDYWNHRTFAWWNVGITLDGAIYSDRTTELYVPSNCLRSRRPQSCALISFDISHSVLSNLDAENGSYSCTTYFRWIPILYDEALEAPEYMYVPIEAGSALHTFTDIGCTRKRIYRSGCPLAHMPDPSQISKAVKGLMVVFRIQRPMGWADE